MIRAPVRVRVAASKISCKQCGREYTTGELAVLTLCESCGTELARENIAVEATQHIIGAQRPAVKEDPSTLDASHLAARISVKRFEILPGAGNAHRDSNYPALVGRVPAAAWVKVA
jgi:predicted  nucleic acid-binding Zn-ribbon protein